jgi:hypothetical protein
MNHRNRSFWGNPADPSHHIVIENEVADNEDRCLRKSLKILPERLGR